MTEYIIETEQLSKKYKNTFVVQDINMNVEKGKIYGLLGKNGAGKTTTMCMLLGLTKPTKGSIKLFGLDALDKKNSKKIYTKIGSIIETPGFYPNLNAKQNLKIFSKIRGTYNETNIKRVLKLVKLENETEKKFKNYSLGMKQRLGLAASLIDEPELLILDEPINGLDPAGIIEIRDMLIDITKKLGITVLISSHILSEIEILADEIGIIDQGKLIREITKEELEKESTKKVIFKVNNLELASKVLNKNNFTKDVDYTIDDEKLTLLTHLNNRANINEAFVKSGIKVSEIKLNEENLEDYFMKLIQKEGE